MQKKKYPILEVYFQLTDTISQGTLWIDQQGNLLHANAVLLKELAYTLDTLQEKTIFEVAPHFSMLSWKRHWERLLHHQNFVAETEYINAQDVIYPVKIAYKCMEIEGATFCCAFSENLATAKRYESLLNLVSENSQLGAWEIDLITGEVLLTDTVSKLLGSEPIPDLTLDKLVSLYQNYIPEANQQALQEKWQAATKKGDSFELEVALIRNEKKQCYVIRAIPSVYEGNVIKVAGTLQALHAPLQQNGTPASEAAPVSFSASPALLEQLKLLAIDKIGTMVFCLNKEGYIRYANELAINYLSSSLADLSTRKLIDLLPDSFQEEWPQYWEKVQRLEAQPYEGFYTLKDNTPCPSEITSVLLNFAGEELVLFSIRDISERKNKESSLEVALRQVQELTQRLEGEKNYLQEEITLQKNFNEIITINAGYRKILQQVEKVADTEATVLILGETGTGKELLARAIHNLGFRRNRPMIRVNCAALPENLIESELFGHEKGAFTGAFQRKIGRFELADKGTIFLDEIGELPLDLQAKLLRVLQEGEFERLGSTKTIKVDVRVIAATNRNLAQMVKEGKFRQDLYYRLNVFPISNMPLRERKDDIPPLINFFLRKYTKNSGKSISGVTKNSMEKLLEYDFPGNIRELENIVERALILTENGKPLNLDAVLPQSTAQKEPDMAGFSFKTLDDMQRDYIIEVLNRTHWKISGKNSAADLLGVKAKTLVSKMRKMNIRREDFLDI